MQFPPPPDGGSGRLGSPCSSRCKHVQPSSPAPRRDRAQGSSGDLKIHNLPRVACSDEEHPHEVPAISSGFKYSTPSLHRSTRNRTVTVVLPEPFGPAMTSKTGFTATRPRLSSRFDSKPGDLGAKPGERLAMLAADVCKRTLEELSELLVGRRERRVREVDVGHGFHHSAPRRRRARTTLSTWLDPVRAIEPGKASATASRSRPAPAASAHGSASPCPTPRHGRSRRSPTCAPARSQADANRPRTSDAGRPR
jgi:hypothetical protein